MRVSKRVTGTTLLVSLLLAACGGRVSDVSPAADDGQGDGEVIMITATNLPAATDLPAATESVVTYRDLLTDVGEHPCQLLPDAEVATRIIPAPEAPPIEESAVDAATGSITGVCDYEGLVRLTVFVGGPETDIQASYDQAVPEANVAIDDREPPRLWGLEDDTLYVLEGELWYGLTIRTDPEKDRLFDAVDLYSVVHDHLPEDPDQPTATPIPTRMPVTFIDACMLLPLDAVEAQIGPLSEVPIFQGNYNPVSGAAQTCIYYADLNNLIVTAFRYDSPAAAQDEFVVWRDIGGVEQLTAPGDDALWLPEGGTHGVLHVLQGTDLLELRIEVQAGDARAITLELAPIALERLIDPLPTPTPGPTAIPLEACDLMSKAEAETIFGAIQGQPRSSSSVGEGDELGPLYTSDCSYSGELGSAYVSVVQGMDEDHARLIYERFRESSSGASDLSGPGDAAFFYDSDSSSRTTIVMEGRFVISATVTGEFAATMSIDIWDYILRHLP